MNDATELADDLDTALNTFRTAKSNQAAGEAHYALRQLLWDNKALIVTALRALPPQQGDDWRPVASAPKDGTLILLLVKQEDGERSSNPIENEIRFRTIGHNNFENDNEDRWQFAGWNWENDYFTQGHGTPTHWCPVPPAPEGEGGPAGLSKESCRVLNEVSPSECLCDTPVPQPGPEVVEAMDKLLAAAADELNMSSKTHAMNLGSKITKFRRARTASAGRAE